MLDTHAAPSRLEFLSISVTAAGEGGRLVATPASHQMQKDNQPVPRALASIW